MERVLVVGSPGAGKSTFARRLAERTGLPLVHLDQHYWQPGWTEPGKEEWRGKVRQLAEQPRWIMDGDYGSTLDMRLSRADTVFFLDFPRWLCLSRVLKRIATSYGRVRPDLAAGCPEQFDFSFLKFVCNYPRDRRPALIERLAYYEGTLHTFIDDRSVDACIASLREVSPA